MSLASARPSPDELFESVEKIRPILEATARKAEEQRSIPTELAEAMRNARLHLAKAPAEVGGYELNAREQIDFFARLSYFNPTAGWVSFNNAGAAAASAALLPDRAIAEVFADDGENAVMCAVSAPTGRATACDGGYRLSGRWSYASGAAGAKYANLAAIRTEPPAPLLMVLPMSDVTMIDNWHVAAVQGSGSVDLTAEDVFVPEHMVCDPLKPATRGSGYFQKLGYKVFVGPENGGFSLGCAQRMLDEVVALARTKKRLLDPETVGSRGAFQLAVARADQAIRAAKSHLVEEMTRAEVLADKLGAPLPGADRQRAEGAIVWVTEALVEVGHKLFPYAGAGSLALSSPIQRAYRDLIGSGQHYVAGNEGLEAWGRAIVEKE